MNLNNFTLNNKLISGNYLKLALEAQTSKQTKLQELLQKAKLPNEGWSDELIEHALEQLSALDANNFEHKSGMGEREGRIASNLVARRHYNFGHGIGRSGNLLETQPKAVGSTILTRLTNALILDVIHLQGIRSTQDCFLVPMATGMSLNLCLLALRRQKTNAKYVLWSRIDQKSCFKSITTAGLMPIIVDNVRKEGHHGLTTNLEKFEELLKSHDNEDVLCIMSTTSCFAPRNCDSVIQLAELAKRYNVAHVINNAYGLQSTYICHQIEQAQRTGRVDVFVQSTDKNLLVPVGGAIIAGFNSNIIQSIAQTYIGRASSSQIIDVFITLLHLGRVGYQALVKQRKTNFDYLYTQLKQFAEKNKCVVLKAKTNPISLTLNLNTLPDSLATKLGSMLYTRGISGARVIESSCNKTVDYYKFQNWGRHENVDGCAYLTVAAAIGITTDEIDTFIKKLTKCWLEIEKLGLKINPMSP